jgi:beta-lactamase class C
MTTSSLTVQEIVDSHCHRLLTAMKAHHGKADVGISVALFYPGNPEVPNFFKYGSAGPGIDITAGTVYAIGSVTKLFTATLAAYLSAQAVIGELGQTLVGPFLANAGCTPSALSGSYWKEATFAQFATQTSGMPDEANGPYSDQLFADQPPSCEQLQWWHHNRESFASNQGYWIYSSAGFVTLGFAVAAAAAAAGLTGGYTALLENIITTPLAMPNTFAAGDVPANAVLAQGYNNHSKAVQVTNAADLKSSAQDLLVWLASVYQAMELQASGKTLTELQQALANPTNIWIASPENPDRQPTAFAMGLGWQIPTFASTQVLAKDGVTDKGGCSCWVGLTRYDPTAPPVGIALLTNQDGVAPDPTARTILQKIIELG